MHKISTRYRTISNVDYNHFENMLTINDLDESDSGVFECYLMNDLGEATAQVQLYVQTKPRIESLKVTIDNVAESDVSDEITVMENRSITIKCNVRGYPTPSVLWFKNNKQLSANDTTLVIDNIQDNDAGVYECAAQTLLGKASKLLKIVVNSPPKIRNQEKQVFIYKQEKELIILNCSIYGHPKPTITWFINSTALVSDETYQIFDDNRYVQFECYFGNSGLYTCNATNDYGENSIEFNVNAVGKLN
jgi:hemicentin